MIFTTLAEEMDKAFVRLAFKSRSASRRARAEADLLQVDEASRIFSEAAREGRLFQTPAPLRELKEERVRALAGGEVVDLSWASGYRTVFDRYDHWVARCPKTRIAHARWWRHQTPSHALVCLHGWGAGAFPFEEQAFRASWLYGLGIDVVFITLPFHARRAQFPITRPLFPSTDPFCSNEGFAQAVFDVRALMVVLRERGAKVAVTGMSLGGFTSALLATVEPQLAAVVPIIPFASLPRILWEHGEGTRAKRESEAEGLTFDRFENAFAATTPIRREPLIDPERMLVIGGERDRVTPLSHARLLRDHFSREGGSVTLASFQGSHLVQLGRRAVFVALARFLGRHGLLPPRNETRH